MINGLGQIQLGFMAMGLEQTNRKTDKYDEYLKEWGADLVPNELLDVRFPSASKNFDQLFYKGNVSLLEERIVSVVGTRAPSTEGILRAKKVSSVLCELGISVMSGLAKGIDTVAHKTALEKGGKTIAVLGTPIHKIYPAENKALAAEIAEKGLLLSATIPEEEHGKFLFPRRNRLMAMLSMATIIIEAGPTSGVIHQAAECLKQGKKLIFLKSLADNKSLPWVEGFMKIGKSGKSGAIIVDNADELKSVLA